MSVTHFFIDLTSADEIPTVRFLPTAPPLIIDLTAEPTVLPWDPTVVVDLTGNDVQEYREADFQVRNGIRYFQDRTLQDIFLQQAEEEYNMEYDEAFQADVDTVLSRVMEIIEEDEDDVSVVTDSEFEVADDILLYRESTLRDLILDMADEVEFDGSD